MNDPDEGSGALAFEALLPSIDGLSTEIAAMPFSLNERLGLATLVAAHFTGTAAAILQKLSEAKGGPKLDDAAWAEEVSKLIVRLTKDAARH